MGPGYPNPPPHGHGTWISYIEDLPAPPPPVLIPNGSRKLRSKLRLSAQAGGAHPTGMLFCSYTAIAAGARQSRGIWNLNK